MQLLLDNHVIRQGDTLHAAFAQRWTGTHWRDYGEPEYWRVEYITQSELCLSDPVDLVETTIQQEDVRLGKLRVISVERPATPVEDITIADLYAAQRRLKERIYETVGEEAQRALSARYEAVKALLDKAIDQIKIT